MWQAVKISAGVNPILLHNGVVWSQGDSGAITSATLPTHTAIALLEKRGGAPHDKLRVCFEQSVSLLQLQRGRAVLRRVRRVAQQHLRSGARVSTFLWCGPPLPMAWLPREATPPSA